MKLTAYTNYALRTLQLAALKVPDLVRVDDVVRVHPVARPHIVKIVHELGRAGYLRTRRGRGGGFTLARPAEEIRIGDVVRLTEGPLDIVECFDPSRNTCPLAGICQLSSALAEALDAFMAVLDRLTLADIAANRADLMARIGGGAPVERRSGQPDAQAPVTGHSAAAGLSPGSAADGPTADSCRSRFSVWASKNSAPSGSARRAPLR